MHDVDFFILVAVGIKDDLRLGRVGLAGLLGVGSCIIGTRPATRNITVVPLRRGILLLYAESDIQWLLQEPFDNDLVYIPAVKLRLSLCRPDDVKAVPEVAG